MTKGLKYGKLSCLQSPTTSGEVFEEFYGALSKQIKKKGFRFIPSEVFKKRVGSLRPKPPMFVRAAWERNGPLGYIAIGRYDSQDRFDFDGYVVGEDSAQANDLLRELANVDDDVMKSIAARERARHAESGRERKRSEISHLWGMMVKRAVPPNLASAATFYLLLNYSVPLGSAVPEWALAFIPVLVLMNLLALFFLSSLTIYYFFLLVLTELNVRRVE